ncbi:MAG TPA: transglutaminase domain-containing protein [Desulfuromonadales bacterium]|nr:transglutaminase domain-containing protein [Desulfuromonadales bacterium]
MKRLLTVLLIAGFCLLATGAFAADQAGRITMHFDLSAQPAGQEARLWIPYPVSDANQKITDISVTGNYADEGVYTDQATGTPMLYARWAKDAKSRTLTFAFDVDRKEVIRRDFPAREGAWNRSDFAADLAPTSYGPTTGEVKKLADRITAGKTTVLAKAKAIYDWTCVNTYRDPKTRGCGKGDVCALLARPGGKCADISSVFVALARAAGVPARDDFGLRQGKKSGQDITTWYHCWAEFYLPGYGWVPVDPADVRKMMLVQHLKLDDPKTEHYRKYFWGGIDAFRVALSHGRDLNLNPRQAAGSLNYLMYPYAEIGGAPLDWLDPTTFKYSITYQKK